MATRDHLYSVVASLQPVLCGVSALEDGQADTVHRLRRPRRRNNLLGTIEAMRRVGAFEPLDPQDPCGTNGQDIGEHWREDLGRKRTECADAWSQPEAWDGDAMDGAVPKQLIGDMRYVQVMLQAGTSLGGPARTSSTTTRPSSVLWRSSSRSATRGAPVAPSARRSRSPTTCRRSRKCRPGPGATPSGPPADGLVEGGDRVSTHRAGRFEGRQGAGAHRSGAVGGPVQRRSCISTNWWSEVSWRSSSRTSALFTASRIERGCLPGAEGLTPPRLPRTAGAGGGAVGA